MAVTVRWVQNIVGHQVGELQTVERGPFIDGCLANGVVELVSEDAPAPIVGVFKPLSPTAALAAREEVADEPSGDQPGSPDGAADGADKSGS